MFSCSKEEIAAIGGKIVSGIIVDSPIPPTANTLCSAADEAVDPELGGSTGDPVVDEAINLINDHRESLGLDPLIYDSSLSLVALAHSIDMRVNDFLSHTGSDSSEVTDRVNAASLDYSVVGENLAKGTLFADPAELLDGWLASDGHRKNIESDPEVSADWTHHGMAYSKTASGDYSWTHVFLIPNCP